MSIKGNGNVGIGTTSPDSTFMVGLTNGAQFRVNYNATGDNYLDGATHHFRTTGGTAEYVTFDGANRRVGIGCTAPAAKLDVCGCIYASSCFCAGACGIAIDWVATSDKRLKTDIQPISNALLIITQLQGVSYCLCNDCSCECHLGLIAQDVEKVLPVIVSRLEPNENDKILGITDEKLALKYEKLTAVFVEAIKEQQIQIDLQSKEIACMRKDLNYYKNYNS
jgi:hypothetical protein